MKGVIILPQELNIHNLSSIIENLKDIISTEDKIVIDAKKVETMDALGLQLILSIEKTASINNMKFELINVNKGLSKYLSFLST